MYKNEYQGGSFFEIFSAQGKDATTNWKLVGSSGIRKIYEKEVKGFIYHLEGSTSTTKMILPKDSRQTLVLIQHYLIFQLHVGRGQDFSLELGLIDLGNNKRRILLSTAQREVQCTPLHAKVPLSVVKRGLWINLCVDLVSMVSDLWKSQTFKAVETISVSATCRLRKIFSMKLPPNETVDENDLNDNYQHEFDYIPKQCQFANDVQNATQIISIKKIHHVEKLHSIENGNFVREPLVSRTELWRTPSMLDMNQKPKKQIAFGSKATLPIQRKSSRERNSAERNIHSTSSRNIGTSHSAVTQQSRHNVPQDPSLPSGRYGSAPALTNSTSTDNVAGQNTGHTTNNTQSSVPMFFKPHPPREPSTEKNRRKIRVKSTSRDRQSGSAGSDRQKSGSVGRELVPVGVNDSGLGTNGVPQNGAICKQRIQDTGKRQAVTDKDSQKPQQQCGITAGTEGSHKNNTSGDIQHSRKTKGTSGVSSKQDRKRSPPVVRHGEKGDRKDVVSEYSRTDLVGNSPTWHDQHSYDKGCKEKRKRNKRCDNSQPPRSVFTEKGVGLEIPEVQSPRKPVEMDESLTAIIAMLKDGHGLPLVDSDTDDYNDSINSTNGHPKEYEDSDQENGRKGDDVYLFTSLPKTAPKCSHSPIQDSDTAGQRIYSEGKVKGSIGDLMYSARGAKPEDDFVLSDSDEDEERTQVKIPNSRSHTNSATSSRGSSGKSVRAGSGSRSNILLPEKGESLPVHSQTVQHHNTGANTFSQLQPGHGLKYDSANYTSVIPSHNRNLQDSPLSRLSRKSLREVSSSDLKKSLDQSAEKPYDSSKYQSGNISVMGSYEELILASMKRQQDEEFAMNIKEKEARMNVNPMMVAKHLYDDFPTTTSDDETFSSLKVPLPAKNGHNYKEEMRYPSRRSTDTLSSSNPRDWSSVFSPPVVLASEILQKGRLDAALINKLDKMNPHRQYKDKLKQNNGKVNLNNNHREEELDLLYDPVLCYYYDPKTNKYYELR